MIQEMSRGSDYQIIFNVQNPDGSTKDLSGTLQLKFGMAKYPSQIEPDLLLTLADPELTILSPLEGKIRVDIKSDKLVQLEADRLYYMELWQENAINQKLTLEAHNVLVTDAIIN